MDAHNDKNSTVDGVEILNWPSGKTRFETHWTQGLKHGKETGCREDGTVESASFWEHGALANLAIWRPDGTLEKRWQCEEGKLVCSVECYDTSDIHQITHWKNGQKHGVQTFRFKTGDVYWIVHWTNDRKDGRETEFYEDGSPKYAVSWENGSRVGDEIFYYPHHVVKWKRTWQPLPAVVAHPVVLDIQNKPVFVLGAVPEDAVRACDSFVPQHGTDCRCKACLESVVVAWNQHYVFVQHKPDCACRICHYGGKEYIRGSKNPNPNF